jgi:hypothetical protein
MASAPASEKHFLSKSSWPLPQKDENGLESTVGRWDTESHTLSVSGAVLRQKAMPLYNHNAVCGWEAQFPCQERAVGPTERDENRRIRIHRSRGSH